jgi:predicted anti-sigma-YlaC factor YlaD
MRCDEVKEHIIDFIYDENDKQHTNVEIQEHLRTCPTCREELEELKQTRKYLRSWKDEPPLQSVAIVRTDKRARRSPGWRYVRYAAIAAMFIICILALANTQVTWNKEEFSFRTSLFPAPLDKGDYYTKAELRSLLKDALDDSEIRMNEVAYLMMQETLSTVEQDRWMDLRLSRSQNVQHQRN